MPFQHNGFERASLDLIREFEAEGWTFDISAKGHAIGRAPDGVTTTSVARRLSRANRSQQNAEADLKRWRARMSGKQETSLAVLSAPLIRRLDGWHPSRTATIAGGVALGWEPEELVNGAVRLTRSGARPVTVRKSDRALTKREFADLRARLSAGGDPLVREMAYRMTAEQWAEYVVDLFEDASIATKIRFVVPGTTSEAFAPDEPADPDVSLASDSTGPPAPEPPGERLRVVEDQGERRPWTARRGGRRTYESKAVEEIVVEGLVVGYGCSKCEAEDDDPHFIAAHYRRAHRFRRGREEQNPDLPDPSAYHPSERLIRALMEFLDSHTPPGWVTGEEDVSRYLAVTALRWMGTRPDLPPPGPVVPLTDAQIVERIRRLVGAEDSVEEVETLTEEVERLEARVAELETFLQAADERADRLQSDVDAWLALAPRPAEG
jgi:hypothetical protein